MPNDKIQLPVRGVIPIEQMVGEDSDDTALLQAMEIDAENYLLSFAWCQSIDSRYFGAGIGGIVGIFFFGIRPNGPGVEDWLWVIVGDLPSAYLVIRECKSPSEALSAYIWEMKRWVKLAENGHTSHDVIPVNVPATPEWAKELGSRLEFLQINVLPRVREAEIERA